MASRWDPLADIRRLRQRTQGDIEDARRAVEQRPDYVEPKKETRISGTSGSTRTSGNIFHSEESSMVSSAADRRRIVQDAIKARSGQQQGIIRQRTRADMNLGEKIHDTMHKTPGLRGIANKIDDVQSAWEYGKGLKLENEGYQEKMDDFREGNLKIDEGRHLIEENIDVLEKGHKFTGDHGFFGNIWEGAKGFADPNFWLINMTSQAPQNLPLMAEMVGGGLAANALRGAGAVAAVAAPETAGITAPLSAALISAGHAVQIGTVAKATEEEASMEAAGVYKTVLEKNIAKGMSPEQAHTIAQKAANKNYAANLAIIGGSNALESIAIFGKPIEFIKKATKVQEVAMASERITEASKAAAIAGKTVKSIGGAVKVGALEGTQEGMQYGVQQWASDEPIDYGSPEAIESIASGFGQGGGMYTVGSVANAVLKRKVANRKADPVTEEEVQAETEQARVELETELKANPPKAPRMEDLDPILIDGFHDRVVNSLPREKVTVLTQDIEQHMDKGDDFYTAVNKAMDNIMGDLGSATVVNQAFVDIAKEYKGNLDTEVLDGVEELNRQQINPGKQQNIYQHTAEAMLKGTGSSVKIIDASNPDMVVIEDQQGKRDVVGQDDLEIRQKPTAKDYAALMKMPVKEVSQQVPQQEAPSEPDGFRKDVAEIAEGIGLLDKRKKYGADVMMEIERRINNNEKIDWAEVKSAADKAAAERAERKRLGTTPEALAEAEAKDKEKAQKHSQERRQTFLDYGGGDIQNGKYEDVETGSTYEVTKNPNGDMMILQETPDGQVVRGGVKNGVPDDGAVAFATWLKAGSVKPAGTTNERTPETTKTVPTEMELSRDGYIKALQDTGVDPSSGQGQQLIAAAGFDKRGLERQHDATTGFIDGRHHDNTLARVWDLAQKSQEPFSYGYIDVHNLGGLNAHRGTHEAANKDLSAMADLIRGALRESGIDQAQIFKKGGDEYQIIAPFTSKEALDSALNNAKISIQRYATDNGLANIPHLKTGRAPGFGIDYAVSDFRDFDSTNSLVESTDLLVGEQKEANSNVTGREDKTGRTDTSSGQAGRTGESLPGKSREPEKETKPREQSKPDESKTEVEQQTPSEAGGISLSDNSIKPGDTVYSKATGAPLKVISVDGDTLRVENSKGNRMPYKVGDVTKDKATAKTEPEKPKRETPIENAFTPKEKPAYPFHVEREELDEGETRNAGWVVVDANNIGWFVSTGKERAEQQAAEMNEKHKPAGDKTSSATKEDPRMTAAGLITGGRVSRVEDRGYKFVRGELKKGSDTYWDLVGLISGYADKLLDSGITIQKIAKKVRFAGNTITIKTERGTSIEAKYALVEAEDLIASHTTGFSVNEKFPQELQPRDRSRAASEIQVNRIANTLEPAFLGESPKASEGAPIIGPDMVVESGNGRTIALQIAYESNKAEEYKNWLAQNAQLFGLKPEDVKQMASPVMVRVRTSEVDRIKFVREANEQSVAAMSATEQAVADAKALPIAMLDMFYPSEDGTILNQANGPFIGRFLDEIVGPNEKGRYITADKTISQEGLNRIRNAIFAKAYGDVSAIEKLAESTDTNVKNIINAMLAAAPKFAKLKAAIEEGSLYPLDITKEIADAARKLSQLRIEGTTVQEYLNQGSMFGDELDPLAKEILNIMAQYNRSAKKIATIFNDYIRGVVGLGDPNQQALFGVPEIPTKHELLTAAVRTMEGADNVQTSLFDGPANGSEKAGTDNQKPTGRPSDTSRQEESEGEYKEVTPATKLAEWVGEKLTNSEKFSNADLWKAAADAFGGTLADGKFTPKDAYDAMELGINKWLAKQDISKGDPKEVIATLQEAIALLPTQANRTAEQDEFQQFSTPPPLAYVAAWVANISKGDTMLEPSAGIGGLAVFGKIAGAKVIVNELSPRRAEVLREMGFDRLFTENAEQLNNILPKDVKPTVVIMNPPFSSTAGRMEGKRDTKNAIKHIEQALKRLEPEGRLVAIVGKGMSNDAVTFKGWWDKLRLEYSVRSNIGIDGNNYKKYGTTFDNRIIVIDKTGPNVEPTITGEVKTLEELLPLLEGIRNDRTYREREANQEIEPSADKPAGEEAPGNGQAEPGSEPALPLPTDRMGDGQRESADQGRIESAGDERSEISGGADNGRGSSAEGDGSTAETVTGRGQSASGSEGVSADEKTGRGSAVSDRTSENGASGLSEATGGTTSRIKVEKKVKEDKAVESALTDAVYSDYSPQKLKVTGAKPHPADLVQSSAMASVEPPEPSYSPNLPLEVIKEGKLSIAQIESVVYAGQSHQETLPSGERRGFFIGDGTGVGKGREISAIILDNMRQGRKKAVWVSINNGLFKDAIRDYGDLGGDATKIFDHSKTANGKDIKLADGIIFTTYKMLGMGQTVTPSGDLLAKKADVKSRLDQLVEWLGAEFDGVIAFDEAHQMQNSLPTRGSRGVQKPSAMALAGVELQRRLPNARVVYVSATGATEVENLAYCDRLGLWGVGTPFASKLDFVIKVKAGGIAAMELVARDMKAMGMYIARNIGFNGVNYSTLEHTLTPEQVEIYDAMAEGWQIVLQNIHQALDITEGSSNGQAKSAAFSAFWGAQQRFFNQILTSMQMPSVIEAIKQDLKEEKAVVLQLVNTNEAQLNRAMSELDEGQTLDDLDMTPRGQLIMFLEKSFPIWQYEEYTDDNGNIRSALVTDSDGNLVANAEAVAMRDELLDKIGAMKVPDGPMEILFNEFGPDMVAEITGRTRRVIKALNEETGRYEKKQETRSKNDATADENAFMEGKKQILVFSMAGGTGRSYHADLTKKNQRKRRHYLIQAGWSASPAVQGFGRTHRSNQAHPPEYILVTTNLKGQKRFISSIARRLDQLGALTKGQRQAAGQGLFNEKDNLEGPMAGDALKRFYQDLAAGRIEGLFPTEILEKLGLTGLLDQWGNLKEDNETRNVPKFLNRLLSLESSLQNSIFDEFAGRLEQMTERAIADGTLDTGLENFKADKAVVKEETIVFTDERSGAETKFVEFEAYHKIKPLSFKEAEKISRINGFLGYYRNTRSKRIYAVRSHGNTTLSNGRIVAAYRLYGQDKDNVGESDEVKFRAGNWEQIGPEDIETLWDDALANQAEYRIQKVHMITGALLPIWDRLPDGMVRVIRVLTDDGRILLGRIIPERAVDATLEKLGAGKDYNDMTTRELVEMILNGAEATLSNGWRIAKRIVSGETRMELMGDGLYTYFRELRDAGAFTERIGSTTRVFIPTGEDATDVLSKIIKYRPISRLTGGAEARFKPSKKAKGGLLDVLNARRKTSIHEPADPEAIADVRCTEEEAGRLIHDFTQWHGGSKQGFGEGSIKYHPEALSRPDFAVPIAIARVLGLKVVPFSYSKTMHAMNDGCVDDQVMYLNINSTMPLESIAWHELGHRFKSLVPDAYQQIEALARQKLTSLPGLKKYYRKKYGLIYTEPDLIEEFISDLIAQAFSKEKAFFNAKEIKEHLDGHTDAVLDKVREGINNFLADQGTGTVAGGGVAAKVQTLRQFTEEEKRIANATCRQTGAVGAKAITPKYVGETSKPSDAILDYGAGKNAVHAQSLREKGFKVTAHEFGNNVNPAIHDPAALDKLYDTVYASNVLNVQSSPEMLRRTLMEIYKSVRGGGRAVFNFPADPRKLPLKAKEVSEIISDVFGAEPQRVGGTNVAPLWEVQRGDKSAKATELAPVFFSQMERVIEEKMPNQAHPGQVMAILSGGKVKKEELDWSGIMDWLRDQKGKVTKEQVLKYVRANDVQVEEVTKGVSPHDFTGVNQDSRFYIDRDNEAWSASEIIQSANELHEDLEGAGEPFADLISSLEYLRQNGTDIVVAGNTKTQYQQYQLPGGDNYRELIFTIPASSIGKRHDDFVTWLKEVYGMTDAGVDYERGKGDKSTYYKEWLARKGTDPGDQYKSSHWQEKNVLAHVRFNDRTGPNGEKILHIEEIQSDWHQEGRRKGYKKQLGNDEYERIRNAARAALDRNDLLGFDNMVQALAAVRNHTDFATRWDIPDEADVMALQEYRDNIETGMIPDAPFKTTWPEFALKRMLRYAAENGYDRMTWTTGEQQAERYNLSTQVGSIQAYRNYKEGKPVDNSYQFFVVDPQGHTIESLTSTSANQSQIIEMFGKDLGTRLIDGADKAKGHRYELSGDGLKIGGEGMKGFYDKMIPAFLNKYVKKWGAKVENITLNLGPYNPYTVERSYEYNPETGDWDKEAWFIFKNGEPTSDTGYPSRERAQELLEAYLGDRYEKAEIPTTVHSIPITDSMKAAVLYEGQPKFKPSQKDNHFHLEDEEIDSRMEAACGVPKETMREKIMALWDEIKRKTREYEYLPRTGEFSELRSALLNHQKGKGIAAQKTGEILDDITKDLSEYEYSLFTKKVILDDLQHEADAGNAIPFGFTPETLEPEKARVDQFVEQNEKVAEAVERRREAWAKIKEEYIDACKKVGFNVDKKLQKEDYFRHQVLEHANAKGKTAGTGKKLKTPTGRGFLRQRGGSALDINTDYLQAEFEVMAQMLYDTQTVKVIQKVNRHYNIINQLKRKATRMNDEAMLEYFEKLIEAHDLEKTPDALYRQMLNRKQAIAYGRLYKLAALGELPVGEDGRFQELVEEMAEAYWEAQRGKAEYADMEIDDIPPRAQIPEKLQGQLMAYLNYLAKHGEPEQGQITARTIFKGMAEKKAAIKSTLGEKYVTWEDLIPEGYVVWQPREGNMFYMVDSIPEQVAQQLLSGILEEVGIKGDDLNKVMAMGQRFPEMIVKEEVALTLDNLQKEVKESFLGKLWHGGMRAWKQWQLVSPRRFFKYNTRNFTGDFDALFAGNPSALKKQPQAWKDLQQAFFSDDPKMSPELRGWFERGGFESLFQAQEISQVNYNRQFRHLMETKLKHSPIERVANLPKNLWLKYWDFAQTSTNFREALLRYACYLDYLEQLKNGAKPKNWGASNRDEVMGLSDVRDRAYKLSNELMGAYDEVSVIGVWLSDNLMPFWRWNEVNFVRYVRLFNNAYQDGQLLAAVAGKASGMLIRSPFIAAKIGKFVIKASALTAMITAWNLLFFGDEEDELPDDVKERLHIILGRDSEGNIRYFSRLGALQDFLDWFGADTPAKYTQDFLSGRASIKEIAAEMAKDPLAKALGAFGPQITLPAGLVLKAKLFPDPLKPGHVYDRVQFFFDSFGLGDEWKSISGKPTKGYAKSLEDLFLYKADPYETAYYANMDAKARYQKKFHKDSEGWRQSEKGDALRNLKLAIRYKDQDAAIKYLTLYAMKGGTPKGLEQSMKSLHPLYGLSKDDKQAFLDQLDAEDRQNFLKAMEYYYRVLGDGN